MSRNSVARILCAGFFPLAWVGCGGPPEMGEPRDAGVEMSVIHADADVSPAADATAAPDFGVASDGSVAEAGADGGCGYLATEIVPAAGAMVTSLAINQAGDIAGSARPPSDGGTAMSSLVFLRTAAGELTFPPLPTGAQDMTVRELNASRAITGFAGLAPAGVGRAVRSFGGELRFLPVVPGSLVVSAGYGIEDNGTVVGTLSAMSTSASLWTAAGDLQVLPVARDVTYALAVGMDTQGWIAGGVSQTALEDLRPALWAPVAGHDFAPAEVIAGLPPVDGLSCAARRMNAAGTGVIHCESVRETAPRPRRSFFYTRMGGVGREVAADWFNALSASINDRGCAAGFGRAPGATAYSVFVQCGESVVDLGPYGAAVSAADGFSYVRINNQGRVIALMGEARERRRAMLWTPCR